MKSYTDLEQSKKLAEILPLESADMSYYFMKDSGHLVNLSPFVLDGTEVRENGMFTYLNCWSLAALLDVLPSSIKDSIGTVYSLNMNKEYIEYSNPNISSLCSAYIHTCGNDNLVNACYEMILKLHELKML